ncbi:hypothetical protein FEZ21_06400 [Pseudomonas sp. 9.1(2019)]|nr:hypothetical protein [Pseudomonas sp. 9.1(2019)]
MLAPERNREHSIGVQVVTLNVGVMERLRYFYYTPKNALKGHVKRYSSRKPDERIIRIVTHPEYPYANARACQ